MDRVWEEWVHVQDGDIRTILMVPRGPSHIHLRDPSRDGSRGRMVRTHLRDLKPHRPASSRS
jgi:hypothetical protein